MNPDLVVPVSDERVADPARSHYSWCLVLLRVWTAMQDHHCIAETSDVCTDLISHIELIVLNAESFPLSGLGRHPMRT